MSDVRVGSDGASPLRAGGLLGNRWQVERVLPGAMGAVLILVDPATGGLLAAKTPRPDIPLDADVLRRFEVEARNWLTLGTHDNVVEALFLEEIDYLGEVRPFLFLEFVDGPTLREVLDRERRLALPVVLDVATGMARGMVHAHGEERAGARLVHRDLKPDNVFLTRNRVVKVSDFGISRALDTAEEIAAEGAGLGTPFYAAPEQMKDARSAGPASDIYAFGAVLHHLLTGAPPFPADTLAQLVFKVLRDAPPAPSSLNAVVPPELDRLVLRCLAKSPSDRPRTFTEVLLELSEIRELDGVWLPPDSGVSCPACGWASEKSMPTCTLCGEPPGPPVRYAPVSPRVNAVTPTLGRSGRGRLVIEGVDVRPRVVREGEQALVTLRLGNAGSEPVDDVFVPYSLPDRHAFERPEGHRRGFRGRVPPTADGAPLRVSWSVRPLREGTYELAGVRATYRTAAGVRNVLRGPGIELKVLPRGEFPLHGRDVEIADLLGCLANADRGACSVLIGRRGFGKSRLAADLGSAARERGYVVARGRCLDRGVDVRGALKEALRQLIGPMRDARGDAEVTASLVPLLGDSARTDTELVGFLVAELLGRPLPRGESPGVMWSRFASALGRQRPFLLILEDAHRDPDVANTAIQMAAHAGRSGATLMVLLTARPDLMSGASGEDFAARLARLSEQVGCARTVRLGPLDREAVARIVDDVLRPNDFPTSAPWFAGRLAEISGGNPLFLGELVRALCVADGSAEPMIVTRDGRWTVSPTLSPDALDRVVPPRLEQLVVARLRTLPPEIADVSRACGVLGDAFETALLREVVGDDAKVDTALRWLEREGVLRETGDTPPRVRFREPLIPEILTREVAADHPEEFLRWNAVAADFLLREDPEDGRHALRVARHMAAAGKPGEAFRLRLAAARRLSERQSFRRAAEVLRGAEELVVAGGFDVLATERVEMVLLRAEALRFSGDYEGAARFYEALVSLGPPFTPDQAAQATAYGKLGKVHEALGRLDEALRCYATGLSLRVAGGVTRDVPMSLTNLAGLHFVRGETSRAESYIQRAIATATEVDAPRARARAQVLRARVLVARGDHGAARKDLREALRWAREAHDRSATADAWNVVGTAALREGRPTRARRHFLRALHMRQEIGDLAAVAGSWNNVAAVDELLGDTREALRGFERSADLQRRIGSVRGLGLALGNVGRTQFEIGRLRWAAAALDEALTSLSRSGDPLIWGDALVSRARVRLARSEGHDDEATAAADELARARTLIEGRGDVDAEAGLLLAEAEMAEARGDTATAGERVALAATLDGLGPSQQVEILSELARLTGDASHALVACEVAARSAGQRTRARALAALGYVRLASGSPETAAPDLRRASGLLQQSGVVDPLLLRVLAALSRSLEQSDPAAAVGAAHRAADVAEDLRRRGFAERVLAAAER